MSQVMFKLTFVPRFFRQFFYKVFNRIMLWSADVNFGHNLRIYNRFYLKKYHGANFLIGDNFLLCSGESINPISRNAKGCIFLNTNSTLIVGNNVGMSSPCIWCDKSITIGNNVKIGALVTILDTDCHSLNYLDRRIESKANGLSNSKPVVIEDDVLIGAQSIVLKGVHIGARSIIGAGSVVTKDIPDDCIAVGNPCKVIRKING